MSLASRNHEVFRFLLLQHEPHRLNVIACETPVAPRVDVTQREPGLQTKFDPPHGAADLASDEPLTAMRRLVVKQDPTDGEHPVGLAVVDRLPVRIDLGTRVRAAWMEGSCFPLRSLDDLTKHFTG